MRTSFLKATLPVLLLISFAGAGTADSVRYLSHAEATRLALAKPQPSYPPMAKQLHLEGEVKIEASIGEDGTVEDVRAVSGNAVLTGAAVSATKRWKFPPILVDGKPVKAVATLSFVFRM